MLEFRDGEKVLGILNDIFPLVIAVMVVHFDVSLIMIDGCISCNIMYFKLF